jgi:hypothetical protein
MPQREMWFARTGLGRIGVPITEINPVILVTGRNTYECRYDGE